jgi:hypothetical protein
LKRDLHVCSGPQLSACAKQEIPGESVKVVNVGERLLVSPGVEVNVLDNAAVAGAPDLVANLVPLHANSCACLSIRVAAVHDE